MPSVKIINKTWFNSIAVSDMKNYLKYEGTEDDELIIQLMASACEQVEKYCNILLRRCTLDVLFEDFDIDEGDVILPLAPCSQVTNVYLIDNYGNETEVTTYTQKGLNLKSIQVPSWFEGDQIKVRYLAGYGINTVGYTTEAIPDIAVQCIYKTVSQWFEDRDLTGTLSGEVRRLLNSISYKSWI